MGNLKDLLLKVADAAEKVENKLELTQLLCREGKAHIDEQHAKVAAQKKALDEMSEDLKNSIAVETRTWNKLQRAKEVSRLWKKLAKTQRVTLAALQSENANLRAMNRNLSGAFNALESERRAGHYDTEGWKSLVEKEHAKSVALRSALLEIQDKIQALFGGK
jgi:hypothetical protein